MNGMLRTSLAVIVLACGTFTATAAVPTIDQSLSMKSVGGAQISPDGRYVATATFDQPGTYVLRGRADDGALTGDDDLTVTVSR